VTLKFAKILCPVDFDRNSAAALRFASGLAGPETTLYLLHVIPHVDRPGFEHYPPAVQLAQESLDNFAREQLAEQTKRELLVREGDPASVIVSAADEFGVDLIVMATHGHKGLVRIVLGSIAERVLREARHPVLTFRPAASIQPPSAWY
jgi:nucleotide-binding universal stress UspA family protein